MNNTKVTQLPYLRCELPETKQKCVINRREERGKTEGGTRNNHLVMHSDQNDPSVVLCLLVMQSFTGGGELI